MDFRLQPSFEWTFLLRRTRSAQKLLPLQFPRLSLTQKGESGFSLVRTSAEPLGVCGKVLQKKVSHSKKPVEEKFCRTFCSQAQLFRPCNNCPPNREKRKNSRSRKGFCRNPRGIFPNEFPGEFCSGFFAGFFRAFFLGQNRRKKTTQKPTAIFKSEFGSSRAKVHTARIRPWTQGASYLPQEVLGNPWQPREPVCTWADSEDNPLPWFERS